MQSSLAKAKQLGPNPIPAGIEPLAPYIDEQTESLRAASDGNDAVSSNEQTPSDSGQLHPGRRQNPKATLSQRLA